MQIFLFVSDFLIELLKLLLALFVLFLELILSDFLKSAFTLGFFFLSWAFVFFLFRSGHVCDFLFSFQSLLSKQFLERFVAVVGFCRELRICVNIKAVAFLTYCTNFECTLLFCTDGRQVVTSALLLNWHGI